MTWSARQAANAMRAKLNDAQSLQEKDAIQERSLQDAYDAGRRHESAVYNRVIETNPPEHLGKV